MKNDLAIGRWGGKNRVTIHLSDEIVDSMFGDSEEKYITFLTTDEDIEIYPQTSENKNPNCRKTYKIWPRKGGGWICHVAINNHPEFAKRYKALCGNVTKFVYFLASKFTLQNNIMCYNFEFAGTVSRKGIVKGVANRVQNVPSGSTFTVSCGNDSAHNEHVSKTMTDFLQQLGEIEGLTIEDVVVKCRID